MSSIKAKTEKGKMQEESIKGVDVPKKASIEVPPPILTKDIKEMVTADVVVVGAGVAGLSAALSAAEAGAKTVALEKLPSSNYRGGWNAAIDDRLLKKAGAKINKEEVIYTIMEWGAYRNDQKVVKLWVDKCGEVMDWLLDMCEEANVEVVLDLVTRPWYFPNYPVVHYFFPLDAITGFPSQKSLVNMLSNNARARGVDFRFNTPAVRLLREGRGRVTGVIAQNAEGAYIQFNARNAVVLCSGDYGSDKEMVKKYADPRALDVENLYPIWTAFSTGVADGRTNTGDGHKIGMWIGAAIDDPPHCAMLFDAAGEGSAANWAGNWDISRQPWLVVNINGERFMNEDIPWAYETNQILQQPGRYGWSVWDDKFREEWPKFKCNCCKSIGPPLNYYKEERFMNDVERGLVLRGQTIEELAQKMKLPVETFKATVARYNELARSGKDLDFGKHPDRLTTLEKPPFYTSQVRGCVLVILGGLKINNKLQVLDTGGNPIPGLYAAGNVSGSFFGDQYPTTVPGLTHSRAWTFGRLAGLAAAADKV